MADSPFISLSWNGHESFVNGQHSCELGHRIARTGSETTDGVYCGWHWDGQRLVVYNDRYGMFPMFYCQTGSRLLVSPSLLTLIEHGAPVDVDHASLYLFLHLGMYVGERTPFERIQVVPPAAEFIWRDGVLTCRGQLAHVALQNLGRDDAIEGFATHFRQAIARRAPAQGRYAVPLSGGRDSRFILLELCRQGYRDALCLTGKHCFYECDPNVEIARELARRLGLEHDSLDPPDSPVGSGREKNRRTHFSSTEHEWYLPIVARLGNSYQSIYDGIGGDVTTDILGGGRCTVDTSRRFETGDLDGVAHDLFEEMETTMGRLLTPTFFSRCDGSMARHLLRTEMEKHAAAPNPVASFFFWNRTRRAVALIPYGLLSDIRHVYSPFLDHDLFDFLTSLPWRSLADNRLRTETLHRAYPDFADLVFADDPAMAAPSAHVRRSHNARYARELLGRMLAHPSPRPWIARRAPVLSMLAASAAVPAAADRYAWLFDRLVYLLQIEELVGGRA